jgi:hypothetical protein
MPTWPPTATSFVSQFRLSGIEAQPEGLFDTPRAIEGATVDLRLTLRPSSGSSWGRRRSSTAICGACRRGGSATGRGCGFARRDSVPETDLATVLSFWPEAAIPETRRWVAEQMEEATLSGVDFAWRSGREAPAHALQMSLSESWFPPPARGAADPRCLGRAGADGRPAGRAARCRDAGGQGGGPVDLAGTTMVVEDTGIVGPDGRVPDGRARRAGRSADPARRAALRHLPRRGHDARPDRHGRVTLSPVRTRSSRRDTPATLEELGLTAEAVVTGFASDTLVPGLELGPSGCPWRCARPA